MSKNNIWIITILLIIISCFLGRSMVVNKTNDFQKDFSLDESMNVEGEGTGAVQKPESFLTENEAAIFGKEMMEQYYGVYEIKEYYPGNDANKGIYRFCTLPDEEIDLLIGQRIVLTENKYVAYDNFRFSGRSGDRDLSDYQIKKYVIDDPEYTIKVSYDQNEFGFEGYPEKSVADILEYPYKMIELPNQEELAEYLRLVEFTPNLYIMDGGRMMWCCEGAFQWFIIEKVADAYEEEDISPPSDKNGQVPPEMYGNYKITEFYPTVYWEDRQNSYERGYLSSEDAQSMIGLTVFLGAKSYQGYSFDSSAFAEDPPRCESEIVAVDSENMNYLVRDIKRSELYGLRDSILPEIYEQDLYKEITVPLSMLSQDLEPPEYFCGTKYYQLDADNNKILMLFMKEFFLLEKTTHAGKAYTRDYVIDYTSFENDDLMVFAEGNGQLEYEQKHVYAGSERTLQFTDKGNWERTEI